jgi:UDP-N-acetylglucosamine 2-epimerase
LQEEIQRVGLEKFKAPIAITYTLMMPMTKKKTHKQIDLSNILSMVDKVFEDELVKAKMIPGDTITNVKLVKYDYKPLDNEDTGYIEIDIKEY